MTFQTYKLTQKDHVSILIQEGTPYEGGIFRCRLQIESNFPQVPPKGYFLTKIFHPNVSSKGEICVNTLKKDWSAVGWSIIHIFEVILQHQVIRCLIINPFPESSLNEEASRLFMDDYDQFYQHAKVYTQVHSKKQEQGNNENEGAVILKKKQKFNSEDVLQQLTNMQFGEQVVPIFTFSKINPLADCLPVPLQQKIIPLTKATYSEKKKWIRRL